MRWARACTDDSGMAALAFLLASALINPPAAAGPTPDQVLTALREGNARFAQGAAKHPGLGVKRRRDLVAGQAPMAIVLSCSDSRVPPELIFDRGLGELFVIRVAGNVADVVGIASVEYAVEHLGTRVLMVLGHGSCGAVKAAIAAGDAHESKDQSSIPSLLAMIQPTVEQCRPRGGNLVDEVISQNVHNQIQTLVQTSSIVREAAEHGDLRLVEAVYDLDSGLVAMKVAKTPKGHTP